MKELKVWNGRGLFATRSDPLKHVETLCVCAYSKADARRMVNEVVGYGVITVNEINTYWSACWGRDMDGIPVERGVWFKYKGTTKMERII